ncbi:MAG TPA: S9 family peptidase [Sphingopyxis sp.]|jgi:dipeptidyl aminopeptidase/acylaminoacyl peptidase|uniref:alpha/beta hydrolase family protein n=1 Tax=Sphingopyxis sp. TaxID=1908224 RepID=UPI002E0DD9B2|nr:S9 family peptidase [Sphingopyxis sp.]
MKNHLGALLLLAAISGLPAGASAGEAVTAGPERPARIATAELAQLPEISNAAISPDGARLAFLARIKGREVIVYRGLHGQAGQPINLPEKVDFNWLRWAGPNKLLFSVGRSIPYFGEEALQTILAIHDLTTGATKIIGRDGQGLEGDDVLFVDPEGQYLLLSIQRTIYDYPSVFRVALPDGKMSEIVRARAPVWEWYADDAGIVRAGVGWDSRKLKFFYRRSQEEKFEQIGAIKPGDDGAYFDIAKVVAGSDDGYVLSAEKTGRQALHKFNYRTREIGDLVYGHDVYDVDDYWLNIDGTALEGVSYTDDRSRIEWFDAGSKKLQAQLDRAIPNRQAWVVSKSRDAKQLLVLATAPDEPGLYYLLDRTKGEMSPIAAMMRGLPPEMLAETKPVTYTARDGTKIPAYLTLPKGRAATGLPLIVHPHGGPYGVRDRLDYDAHVQFFANRGYAVLQPNYRGSGGYGTAFGEAGVGQIGKKMQDDLDDGMDWLVKEGTVDKARVCMIGASYGGYAALWAVARNPDRYRCAASFAGVADWKAMLKYDARYLTKEANASWQARVTGAGELDLVAVSPTHQASRIARPVLIGHGEDDSNVPISQSKKLVAALKAAGNRNFEYVAYRDEGHGFSDPANQKDWFDRLDAFLAKHNPAE